MSDPFKERSKKLAVFQELDSPCEKGGNFLPLRGRCEVLLGVGAAIQKLSLCFDAEACLWPLSMCFLVEKLLDRSAHEQGMKEHFASLVNFVTICYA